jgi:hypothetical protein
MASVYLLDTGARFFYVFFPEKPDLVRIYFEELQVKIKSKQEVYQDGEK